MTETVMIVGVGGQGTLLASRILGYVMMKKGLDVKISEVHGMSQRGGSVVTYVRYGDKVYSPIADLGTADMIISFERLEAARWLPYLKRGGKIVMNTQKIDPMPVITGVSEYPDDIEDNLRGKGICVTAVDALSLAEAAGTAKAVNTVLLGVCAKQSGFSRDMFYDAIENTVKPKFIEINKKAFDLGYDAG